MLLDKAFSLCTMKTQRPNSLLILLKFKSNTLDQEQMNSKNIRMLNFLLMRDAYGLIINYPSMCIHHLIKIKKHSKITKISKLVLFKL